MAVHSNNYYTTKFELSLKPNSIQFIIEQKDQVILFTLLYIHIIFQLKLQMKEHELDEEKIRHGQEKREKDQKIRQINEERRRDEENWEERLRYVLNQNMH